MIEYKDLQIGNYIKIYTGEVYQVQTIYYDMVDIINSEHSIEQIMCDRIYPIEVTDEILNKIGFHKQKIFITELPSPWFVLNLNEFNIKIDNCSTCKDRKWSCQIDDEELLGSFDFNYLHELQNGIRLITKGDLEVNL